MVTFLEVVAMIGAILGGLVLIMTFTSANGAPQEAAGAALSLGLAVIPYCLAAIFQRRAIIDGQKPRP